MKCLGEKGYEPILIHGSKDASLNGQFNAALAKFFSSNPKYAGDESLLEPFRGKTISGRELLTDPDQLRELADAGELSFDDLYAAPSGGSK